VIPLIALLFIDPPGIGRRKMQQALSLSTLTRVTDAAFG
jgi:hypothetical protein